MSSEAEQRTSYLETKLREVTTDANVLATEFMTLREQLSNENAYLSTRITELTHVRDDHTAEITRLAQENLRIAQQNEDMVRRIKEVGQLVEVMGGHRHKLMGKVGEWEDGLMVAGREGWRAPATPRAPTTPGSLGRTVGGGGDAEKKKASKGAFDFGSVELQAESEGGDSGESESENGPPMVSASDSGEAVIGGVASL